jgi:hypothetical protein
VNRQAQKPRERATTADLIVILLGVGCLVAAWLASR